MHTDDRKHDNKVRILARLLREADVVFITETHGTQGFLDTWRPPYGATGWWSAGATAAHAGVGILVARSFLAQFSAPPEWSPIWPGRSGQLRLSGAQGILDLVVAYLPTGTGDLSEHDRYGFWPSDDTSSWPGLRHSVRQRISQAPSLSLHSLTILGGDFNYVTHRTDRQTFAGEFTGQRDAGEEADFRLLFRSTGLQDQHQPDPTFRGGSAESRVDRFYANHHTSSQLDHEYSCHVLEWTPHSDHRPLFHARGSNRTEKRFSLSDPVARSPRFRREVRIALQTNLLALANNPARPPGDLLGVERLQALKDAYRSVAQHWHLETAPIPAAESAEDKLSATMAFIRASENQAPAAITHTMSTYPHLRDLVPNPYSWAITLGAWPRSEITR